MCCLELPSSPLYLYLSTTKANPRAVPCNAMAVVQITTERPVCVETSADCKALGRFVLRIAGKTVGAGLVSTVL